MYSGEGERGLGVQGSTLSPAGNHAGRAVAASSAVALAAARAPNPPSREGRLAVSAETADQAGRRGRCLANLTKEAPWCWFVSSMALSPPASREGERGMALTLDQNGHATAGLVS